MEIINPFEKKPLLDEKQQRQLIDKAFLSAALKLALVCIAYNCTDLTKRMDKVDGDTTPETQTTAPVPAETTKPALKLDL